jgi:hypothetical protein
MKTKQSKKNRKLNYLNEILPNLEIRDDIQIKQYQHFIRITHNEKSYDYYPGAQRLFTHHLQKWKFICLEDFTETITNTKIRK